MHGSSSSSSVVEVEERSACNSHITWNHISPTRYPYDYKIGINLLAKAKMFGSLHRKHKVQIQYSVFQQPFQMKNRHVKMRNCERWQWCADSCQLLYTIVGVNSCHGIVARLWFFQNNLRLKCAFEFFWVCARVACNLLLLRRLNKVVFQ